MTQRGALEVHRDIAKWKVGIAYAIGVVGLVFMVAGYGFIGYFFWSYSQSTEPNIPRPPEPPLLAKGFVTFEGKASHLVVTCCGSYEVLLGSGPDVVRRAQESNLTYTVDLEKGTRVGDLKTATTILILGRAEVYTGRLQKFDEMRASLQQRGDTLSGSIQYKRVESVGYDLPSANSRSTKSITLIIANKMTAINFGTATGFSNGSYSVIELREDEDARRTYEEKKAKWVDATKEYLRRYPYESAREAVKSKTRAPIPRALPAHR